MGVCRDILGKPAYTATTEHGVFSVRHGENRICRHYPYMTTDAGIDYGLPMPESIEPFDNFIQAVIFMKSNIDKLR